MSTQKPLDGKVAIVTGAGSGLGRAAARAFGWAGADIVANDIEAAGLQETATLIEETGARVATHVGDVSAKADVEAMVATAVETFGGLDVMHANAAISIYRDLAELREDELDAILGVNFKGPLLCAQAAIPAMKARGGGSIVFVSSVQGYQGLPGCVPYAGAKAALVAAARTLSVEVGRHGIRVNALVPGTIDTPMLHRDLGPMNVDERDAFLERVRSANSLGRIGRPEEVAAAAVFLAGDASSYVSGSAITVDGGFLAVKSF
jgi:NAD(P)-dependent dehydrogenase (short-subunit alcohol dehydrogenase family)